LSSRNLQIAELLHQKKTYRQITKEIDVSNTNIKATKDMMAKGQIEIDEQGKAFFAKAMEAEIETLSRKTRDKLSRITSERTLQETDEDYILGNMMRLKYTLKAHEADLSVGEYVINRMKFSEEYKDKVPEMEETIADQQTLLKILWDAFSDKARVDQVRIAKMKYYNDFIKYLLELRIQGFTLPQGIINDFLRALDQLGRSEIIEITHTYTEDEYNATLETKKKNKKRYK